MLLGFVGTLMMVEAVRALIKRRAGIVMRERMPRQHNWVHGLPMRIRFKKSKLYISVLPVLGLGLVIGFLGSLLGIGGGFILVPALVYLLRVPGNIVLGTSLLQVVAMMSATMILHAISSQSVDILLAFCLMVGGVIGAQFGAQAGQLSQGRAAALPSRSADHRGGAAVRRLAGHSARRPLQHGARRARTRRMMRLLAVLLIVLLAVGAGKGRAAGLDAQQHVGADHLELCRRSADDVR